MVKITDLDIDFDTLGYMTHIFEKCGFSEIFIQFFNPKRLYSGGKIILDENFDLNVINLKHLKQSKPWQIYFMNKYGQSE